MNFLRVSLCKSTKYMRVRGPRSPQFSFSHARADELFHASIVLCRSKNVSSETFPGQ